MRIFCLTLCAYLFINHLLHLFAHFLCFYLALLLLPRFVHPIRCQTPLRYLHTVRSAANFDLVGAQCYLKVTPHHNHC
jgi:hypothetical protein